MRLRLGLVAALAAAAAAVPAQTFSTVSLSHIGDLWSYTLGNPSPVGSDLGLSSFGLTLAAPISNVAAPNGWQIETDFASFVQWYNDEPFPYPNDVLPGQAVAGFSFRSLGTETGGVYDALVWDHATDAQLTLESGPTTVPGPVPEPAILAALGLGAMGMLRRRRIAG